MLTLSVFSSLATSGADPGVDPFLSFVTALLVALVGAVGGIVFDRRFQKKDQALELYLEWLGLLDQQASLFKEWIRATGDEQKRIELEFERQFLSIRNRLGFLASKKVQEAVVKYHDAAQKTTTSLVAQGKNENEIFKSVFMLPERDRMIKEMKKGVRSWYPRRRG